jgi:hypothetical protein
MSFPDFNNKTLWSTASRLTTDIGSADTWTLTWSPGWAFALSNEMETWKTTK